MNAFLVLSTDPFIFQAVDEILDEHWKLITEVKARLLRWKYLIAITWSVKRLLTEHAQHSYCDTYKQFELYLEQVTCFGNNQIVPNAWRK